MKETKSDGKQAFPTGNPTHGGNPGMTLRDWFAGQALVGLVASPATDNCTFGSVASSAYGYADAMLKERKA